MKDHDPAPIPCTTSPSLSTEMEGPPCRAPGGWGFFLDSNPFYPLSAAFLLFGIYRATVDVPFLAEQVSQLVFNLVSLQLYETLLVGTAIFLATRRIWYDSTLLVFLENLLVATPFILVSDAVDVGRRAAWSLCVIAVAMAIGRFWGIKRFIPQLRLPARLLVAGAGFLVLNAAIPLFFRSLHESNPVGLFQILLNGWLLLLPTSLAFANVLPRPIVWGGLAMERSWLPISFLAIWVVATGAHLWCIGYIYDVPWRFQWMTPTLWTAAWTLFNRRTDFHPETGAFFRNRLLAVPCFAPFLAISNQGSEIVFALTFINAIIYTIMRIWHRENAWPLHLALISLGSAMAAMPEMAAAWWGITWNRPDWILAGGAACVLAHALLSKSPWWAFAGAMVAAMITHRVIGGGTLAIHLGIQSAAVFFLLHSLRWNDARHTAAWLVRILAATVWITHSAQWVYLDRTAPAPWLSAYAGGTLVICVLARIITGRWGPRVVSFSASAVLLSIPAPVAVAPVRRMPLALVAMIASYLIFGLGAWLSLKKSRARRAPGPAAPPSNPATSHTL